MDRLRWMRIISHSPWRRSRRKQSCIECWLYLHKQVMIMMVKNNNSHPNMIRSLYFHSIPFHQQQKNQQHIRDARKKMCRSSHATLTTTTWCDEGEVKWGKIEALHMSCQSTSSTLNGNWIDRSRQTFWFLRPPHVRDCAALFFMSARFHQQQQPTTKIVGISDVKLTRWLWARELEVEEKNYNNLQCGWDFIKWN